jgi:hypothetical protein
MTQAHPPSCIHLAQLSMFSRLTARLCYVEMGKLDGALNTRVAIQTRVHILLLHSPLYTPTYTEALGFNTGLAVVPNLLI